MGRAKLPIKLINAERSRYTTFTKRRRGLKKKMYEFSTLCDVDACMIIYGSTPDSSPQTWPEDPAEVRRVIDRFRRSPKEERDKRQQDIPSLLRLKNKKLQDDLEQRRRENAELASLMLWNRSSLEAMDENGVLDLQVRLDCKIKQVSDNIESLKEIHSFKQPCLGGSSEVQPESTSPYFPCLGGAERRHVARYMTPLQSVPIQPPPLPAATIGPPESEEAILHWGYNNNICHDIRPCGDGGATSCWLSDYETALITGATPAYFCTQLMPCMQRPTAFGRATQQSSASFTAEGTTNFIMDGQKTMNPEELPQNTVSHPRPYSLPSFPLPMQEEMDLFMGLTDQGLDHFLGYLMD